MDNLETKITEHKPSSLVVGFHTAYEITKSIVKLPLDYVIGFLPYDVRLKLLKGDEQKIKRAFLINDGINFVAGFSMLFYGVIEKDEAILSGGFVECMISVSRFAFSEKETSGHPLFTIPYHVGKKITEKYSTTKQKLIDHEKQKILTAQNKLLLEDKVGSLSHPEETDGKLSLPKYTPSFNDEEHF